MLEQVAKYIGWVVGLFGDDRDGKGRLYGYVEIEFPYSAEEGSVRALAFLTPRDYKTASDCHLDGSLVEFRAVLRRRKCFASFESIKSFKRSENNAR